MSEIIKTRAKYIDTEDSTKQTPIIQMQRPLPNTVRVSRLDGGRDNPFRPGSAIYKSADPIVDYYKNGQASRPQSPSDQNSLIDSKPSDDNSANQTDDRGGKSCWRKYMCCCLADKCCRCCCSKSQESKAKPKPNTKPSSASDDLDRHQAKEAAKNTPTNDQYSTSKANAKILVTNHYQDTDTTQPKRVQIEPSTTSSDQASATKQNNKCTRTRNKSNRCVIS